MYTSSVHIQRYKMSSQKIQTDRHATAVRQNYGDANVVIISANFHDGTSKWIEIVFETGAD